MNLLIVGGLIVTFKLLEWTFNELEKEEEKKQGKLREDIQRKMKEYNSLGLEYSHRRHLIYKEAFYDISEKFREKIYEYRKDREQIKEDLNKLYEQVKLILASPETSPFLANGLRKEIILIEDAKNRIDAYFKYLSWMENEINRIEELGLYENIFSLDVPNPLLPDDWLYVGKLLLLDGKHEINITNKYGQRLKLNGVWKKELSGYDFSLEEEALSKYETNIPMLVVYNDESKNLYRGSVVKGELYVNHIQPGIPFVVVPEGDRPAREVNYYTYKGVVRCKMKRKDKNFPLKDYQPLDEIIVYPIEHDLTLREIYVSEKPYQQQVKNIYPVYLTAPDEETYRNIVSMDILKENKYSVIEFDVLDGSLKLKVGKVIFDCKIDTHCLNIVRYYESDISSPMSVILPFNVVLLTKKEFTQNMNLLEDTKYTISQLIDFLQAEFKYKERMDQVRDEYQFFDRWLRIVDSQIKKEEFEYDFVYYQEMVFGNNRKEITFYVDRSAENLKKLSDINSKIKEAQEKIPTTSNTFRVALEIRTPQEVSFSRLDIGSLKDDIDLEEGTVTVLLDSYLPENYILNSENKLYIGIYFYPAHLYRQKKALVKFQNGELANPDLKRMLISPSLITKTTDPYEEEAFDFQIRWRNENLTENQKDIIKRALLEKNIFLIQGPPGTGKTTVIKEIIYQFLKDDSKKRVLIVSQQNVAVDNAISRIYRENLENWFNTREKSILRIATDENKVDEVLREFTVDKWFKEYKESIRSKLNSLEDEKLNQFINLWFSLVDKDDISEIDKEIADVLISSHQIVGATCVGFANKRFGLERNTFDLVIIDEAARATPPELLISILTAKKVILIGDQYQLPPSIGKALIDDSTDLDFDIREFIEKTFFERLFEEAPETNKGFLTEQFRMPAEIGELVSILFYNGKLKNGVIKSKENFIDKEVIKWIDVDGKTEKEGKSSYNLKEAEKVRDLLIEIQKKVGDSFKTVAVITPYSAQKKVLQKLIDELVENKLVKTLDIKCDTVDSFQGQEADIVIYSVVKTSGRLDFVLDRKRLNVAISRTRENLYFVGNKDYLYNAQTGSNINYFREIIDYIISKWGEKSIIKT